MKTVAILVASVGLALVLQGLLSRGVGNARLYVDLPLVAVVYVALSRGRTAGLFAGSLAGLAQDAASGGVLGVGGMSKSIAGFLAGLVGTQFIVTQAFPRLLVFVGASLVNSLLFMGIYLLLGLWRAGDAWLPMALQAAGNGLAGALLFETLEFLPGARARWRVRREYRQRARFR